MAPQQAGGGEAEALAGGGQGVQVVGVIAAKADQARGFADAGLLQVMAKLEPLVAADQWVDQVQPQDGGLDIGSCQPRQVQGLQGRLREVEKHRASLPAKSWGCFAAPAISEFRRQPRTLVDRPFGIQLGRHISPANQVHRLPRRRQAVLQFA